MKKLLWLLIVFLIFNGCTGKIPSEKILKLQERIDAIAERVESGEGLKAKKGIEDIEIAISNLEKKLDELDKELEEINKKLDELNKKYTSHLKELHQ